MDPRTAATWIDRIQTLWREQLPLAAAMQARIARLDSEVLVVSAPLAANVNHMGTAFGGSLQTLGTLTGWAVTVITAGEDSDCSVIVRNAHARFHRPVTSDLVAECALPDEAATSSFQRQLARRGRALLRVEVQLPADDGLGVEFRGEFAAVGNRTGEQT